MLRVFAVCCACVLGCSGAEHNAEQLEETLKFFHGHLVAGDVDRASAYVSGTAAEEFQGLHDPARNAWKLEDFVVISMLPDTKVEPDQDPKNRPERMIVLVGADVRRTDSITIKKSRFRETWQKLGQRWFLVEEELATARGPQQNGR